MTDPVAFCLVGILAYVVGSFPFGLWLGKAVKGIDVRTMGSGNIGATNVARVIGMKWGITTLVLDALKGLLPTLLLPILFFAADSGARQHAFVLAAVCTVVGHMFSVFLRFHGGKGVATSLGVIFVISWIGALVALAVFAAIVFSTQLVALASILASVGFSITVFVQLAPEPFTDPYWSTALFAIGVPLLIIVRHHSNIARLLAGTEEKFSVPAAPLEPKNPNAAEQ